ncbi:hypothetical protein L208DRAFT_1269353 [Tricholoma matsutake]|nr:hypothetical protein L208DRAFT_1269353 [Tricholoma matsutake 945]
MQPHAVDFVCDTVHDEMDAAKPKLYMSTIEVNPDFISTWDINSLMEPIASDTTPIWSHILEAATETRVAKEKSRAEMSSMPRFIIYTHFAPAKFKSVLVYMAWSTGASQQLINVLNHLCLSMSYTSILSMIDTLAERSIQDTCKVVEGLHAFAIDNVNVSTLTYIEQAPGAMSKVQSGTVAVLYKLPNAKAEDMLLEPMMLQLSNSSPLTMSDLHQSAMSCEAWKGQCTVNIVAILVTYVSGFSHYSHVPELQHQPRQKQFNILRGRETELI